MNSLFRVFCFLMISSIATANSSVQIKNYLFKNGFKYRDAYSGEVDSYKSVNQVWVDKGVKQSITKSQAQKIIRKDLKRLNTLDSLLLCQKEVLAMNPKRGSVLNVDQFMSSHDYLRSRYLYDFYGQSSSCDKLTSCPSHRSRLTREYRCSLEIMSIHTGIKLYESFYTLTYASFAECKKHAEEILKIDANSALYEIYLSKDSEPYCAVNILEIEKEREEKH